MCISVPLICRDFKSFSPEASKEDLSEVWIDCGDLYNKFDIFTTKLNKLAPKKMG